MQSQTEHGDLKNEILTIKEVAAYLRVSRTTVWRWCQQGTIPAVRVGSSWRIRRDDLLGLLKTFQFPNSTTMHPRRSLEDAPGNGPVSGK